MNAHPPITIAETRTDDGQWLTLYQIGRGGCNAARIRKSPERGHTAALFKDGDHVSDHGVAILIDAITHVQTNA